MNRLEKLIMPLILTIGIIAILLANANPDHIIIVARVVGIFLGIVLSLAFIFRLLGMFLRYLAAKKIITETQAEIERLRAVVGRLEEQPPLLFLLDEILHGTNSHDRVAGAGQVLTQMVERGAIGLVTTHDLALTALADEMPGRVRNIGFIGSITTVRPKTGGRARAPGVVR